MKRFSWALQRLLDVTIQRELALRAELFDLSRRIAQRRQELVRRRSALDAVLGELRCDEADDRLTRRELFMRCAATATRELDAMSDGLARLRDERRAKSEQFSQVRASRESLERLRQRAYRRWWRQYLRFEQKQTDEAANLASARRRNAARRAGAGRMT